MAGLIRLALVILVALVVVSHGWSGNYGSRVYCVNRRERVCAYKTWAACCSWKWIWKAYQVTRSFCLPGWRHNGDENCNDAICNPTCKNNGTCTQPNNCTCTAAFDGPTCEGRTCSHLKPCYPGECSIKSTGGSTCNCETNFQFEINGCLEMRPEITPEIYQCQIVLRHYASKQGVFMDKYSILLDTTVNRDQTMGDELWSNRIEYNKIDFLGISTFDLNVTSPVPSSYISEAKFGLVDVKFETVLDKVIGNTTANELICDDLPSQDKPTLGVHNCTVLNTTYTLNIENGDVMTIKFTIKSGGYRKLKNIDTGTFYQTEYYTGQTMIKIVMFRFDTEKPYHCFPKCTDDSKILEFGNEYTQSPLVQLRWNGWKDGLSGVYRYAWEIFRLTANGDGELREEDPLGPIKIAEINHTDSIEYPSFTLPEPGLYSIILQVADKANNSAYVRRFVLYDPDPRIQISDDPDKSLHSSSSTKESNYTRQDGTTDVMSFDWTGFFYNPFLEDNKLLNKILDYPLQFYDEGVTEHKYVTKDYKNEVGRTQAEVPNALGMTSFQYGYHKDNHGGTKQPYQPATWFELPDPVQTKFDLDVVVYSGETLVFWVKATDPFGIERIEKTQSMGSASLSSGLSAGAIVGIIIGVLLLVLIVILIVLFVTNRQPFTKRRKERSSVYIQNVLGSKSKQTNVPQTSTGAYPNNAYRYDEDDVYLYGGKEFERGMSWQIPHHQLTLLGDIATGKFARISKAKIRSNQDEVVAKMLKDNFTPDDEMLMRAKVNYMATVVGSHPNVLAFVGAVIDNSALGPVMILEYCDQGQLDKWLISQRGDLSADTSELLQRIAFGVCKGMAYLAYQKVVHKKLAARNVLLTFTREPKITGFGPSKSSEDEDAKERIPIKWTAPECMTSLKEANQRSDVWSFGIVLWEIFSLGEVPYGDIRSRDVEDRIKGGYRMSKPEMCNSFYNAIMANCWLENPRKRESFKKIQEKISGTFVDKSGDDFYYYR